MDCRRLRGTTRNGAVLVPNHSCTGWASGAMDCPVCGLLIAASLLVVALPALLPLIPLPPLPADSEPAPAEAPALNRLAVVAARRPARPADPAAAPAASPAQSPPA